MFFRAERQDRMEAPCPLDHAGNVQPARMFGFNICDFAPLRWLGAAFFICKHQCVVFVVSFHSALCTNEPWPSSHTCCHSGVAQWLACWAHNPKVRGSKPRSATLTKTSGLLSDIATFLLRLRANAPPRFASPRTSRRTLRRQAPVCFVRREFDGCRLHGGVVCVAGSEGREGASHAIANETCLRGRPIQPG